MTITWKAKLKAYGNYWPLIWFIAIVSSVIGGPFSILTIIATSDSHGGWSEIVLYSAVVVFILYFIVNIIGLVATTMKHWAIGVLTFIIFVASWFICALMFLGIGL